MERAERLQALREQPEVPVLIIGGGVNGIGTLRDLALQGVDALLVERGDFGSGTSAASSHMLHGGIRYLENGEFRLVREALHERDMMLQNAPHYAKPLRTTVPIFRWFSGLRNAPLKFLNLLDQPAERGAVVLKLGLLVYDWFTRQSQLPRHEFRLRASALREYPALHPDIVCAATYYDAWMPCPERICLELLLDAEASHRGCHGLNYVRVLGSDSDSVTLRDELSGACFAVKPQTVVNAAGPWIDLVNAGLGSAEQRFIGGTKGAHLVLHHPELLAALQSSEIFFENEDGRIVLILPFMKRVLIGTTDIRLDAPDEAVASDEEIDYLLGMVGKVFPGIAVERSHIVFTYSGLRPLPYSGADGETGRISRDHSIRSLPPSRERPYPIHALIGGKWTTFRAFAEQATDTVLQDLQQPRRRSSAQQAIGGGRDYPADPETWLQQHARTGITMERLRVLFARYGTRAAAIAASCAQGEDRPLAAQPAYSQREIEFLLRQEKVQRLDDLLLRRTLLAMLGQLSRPLLAELAEICAATLGWSGEREREERARALQILRLQHRVEL